ncbi:SMP-30/gluconolactonase/LRE family protein [Polyangium mundeleinium]|uniref:SMP-30/gluconolactonase/LRE family protein n=1 Tax=Polyangium mundeleinium TaxID=2995306 RepID=A0ABT5EFP1_9BACT|nr:SMP-30/gluconolactonase/LRE family protein [Polyangium mundeleinium]MDC0740638.1 SMP-30/gluconolactonase/LRE family protein [Polyangium mundeleinium]
MHSRSLSIAIVSFLVSTSALVAGCSDDPAPASTQSSSSGSGGSGGAGGNGGTGGQGGDGGGGGSSSAPEVLAAFDPMKGEYVEGLDIKDGVAYVGAVLTGQILKVDLATGAISPFGAMPAFPQNGGALVGLTLGPDGAVYGALNITAAGGPQTGIYRVAPAGGDATLFASDPGMVFNNDLRFDAAGDLFVSDSMSGAIFKVSKDGGTVSKWVEGMLLTPDPTVCGVQTNFHLGINGFVRAGDAYYATNTDRASIVKIPVNADGSAGTPEVFLATDCATLSGADGIAVDPSTGDLIVAINYKETILRIGMDKSVKSIASGEPLQSPASLVVDDETLYITNAAFAALASDPSKAKPSLAKLALP